MATIADVARRAGVSMSTVSYALSGVRPVSEATRRRIEAAMKELDYTPNAVAQGLAGRKTRILALVLPTDEMPVDPFTGEIIVGAAEAAREQGYHLLLWTEPASLATELPELLGKRLIDGAIVLSIRMDDDRIDALRAAGLPMTMIGRTRDPAGLPFVDTDADLVAELALAHLAALGHRAVAYVGTAEADPSEGYGFTVRLQESLRRVAGDLGLRLATAYPERSTGSAAERVGELLRAEPALSAAVTLGDETLAGTLAGAAGAGRQVPGDLAVVGLLTTPQVAELVHPAATTVSPNPAELGRRAAAIMIAHLGGDDARPPIQELVAPELVVRSTSVRR